MFKFGIVYILVAAAFASLIILREYLPFFLHHDEVLRYAFSNTVQERAHFRVFPMQVDLSNAVIVFCSSFHFYTRALATSSVSPHKLFITRSHCIPHILFTPNLPDIYGDDAVSDFRFTFDVIWATYVRKDRVSLTL